MFLHSFSYRYLIYISINAEENFEKLLLLLLDEKHRIFILYIDIWIYMLQIELGQTDNIVPRAN